MESLLRHLEIEVVFLSRSEDGSQKWAGYAIHHDPFRIGPVVEATSRKSVRSKARTAYRLELELELLGGRLELELEMLTRPL